MTTSQEMRESYTKLMQQMTAATNLQSGDVDTNIPLYMGLLQSTVLSHVKHT